MRTPKQIAASRANGAKSRGPKTPEGKAIASRNSSRSTGPNTPHGKSISAQNALRHGYLAESVVLPTESTAAFNAVVADLYRELQPETPIEYRLIEIMAVSDWRLMRLWCFEMAHIAHAIFAKQRAADPILEDEAARIPVMLSSQAFNDASISARTLELMSRYEMRYSRQYSRAMRDYKAHRAERLKLQERSEPTEAQGSYSQQDFPIPPPERTHPGTPSGPLQDPPRSPAC